LASATRFHIRGQSSSKGFGVFRKNLHKVFFLTKVFRLGSCREIRLQALGIWFQENQTLTPKSVAAALEREGRYVLLGEEAMSSVP